MGKRLRAAEPNAQKAAYRSLGIPIVGEITEPACLEGGDVVWLDDQTIAVGRGYRTDDEGILQLRALLGDSIDELIAVSLPHWRGPGDVLHLMSLISPIDRDLAVVYSPLLPVDFRQRLIAHGCELIEVPDEEFERMGTNVLALGPRDCLMLEGSPRTRKALEHAGARVREYVGNEISVKGAGGPTCLTRPLARAPVPLG
jgi:N-dimethylarginine dimethylaminohydrolase